MTPMFRIFNIILVLSYCAVYVRHFLFPCNKYFHNLSCLLFITYCILGLLNLIGAVATKDLGGKGATLEERLAIWGKLSKKRSIYDNILLTIEWILILGLGVIGKWAFFIPALLAELFGELARSNARDLVKKHRKENNIPEPEPEIKDQNSRYKIIKSKKL